MTRSIANMVPVDEVRALLDDAERAEAVREIERLKALHLASESEDDFRLAGFQGLVDAYDAVRRDHPVDRDELRRAFDLVDRELRRLDVDQVGYPLSFDLVALRTHLRNGFAHEHGEGPTLYEAFLQLESYMLAARRRLDE